MDKSPYRGMQPDYDERKNVASGDYYGIGITQPYGKERPSSKMSMPMDVRVKKESPRKLA